MPKDYTCKSCDYTISLGWYHYHELQEGYGARTTFACGHCGITHHIEHAAPLSKLPDRYLYLKSRSSLDYKSMTSQLPSQPKVSNDIFTGFDSFKCPVCHKQGEVITGQSTKTDLPKCPLCKETMALITEWIT